MRIDLSAECTGCSACYASCTQGAIDMVQDVRGFYVPYVDSGKCVDCGLCLHVCPLSQQKETRDTNACTCTYLYMHDEEERKKSCSGGVFYALATEMLKTGGLVCGCVWDEDFVARHICTDDPELVKHMRGSKYVQSHMGDCFRQIKKALMSGRQVLFCGTPCQATALNGYVGEELQQNLLTVGLICGGVPSPKVWEKYKQAVEKKMGGNLTTLNMRSKRLGWLVPEFYAAFSNGKKVQEVFDSNLYGLNFYQGLFVNESCMQCQFKLDVIKADIVIGDHWGIDNQMLKDTKNKGASVAFLLTEKGREALEAISSQLVLREGDIATVIRNNQILTENHGDNCWREEFFQQLDRENILVLLQKYYFAWEKKVNRSPLVRIAYKLHLYAPLFMFRRKLRK